MNIEKMYNSKKGRCCIQEGDMLTIGECKILFTSENNKQVAKVIYSDENIPYNDGVNFDEMFTDLIINNLSNWDIAIERNNEILFELKH